MNTEDKDALVDAAKKFLENLDAEDCMWTEDDEGIIKAFINFHTQQSKAPPIEEDELVQDFKELNLYLDNLSTQTEKDAGNLWIQFSDKFRHFEIKVKAALLNRSNGLDEVESVLKYLKENDYKPFKHEKSKIDGWLQGGSGISISTKELAEQYLSSLIPDKK